MVHEVNIHPPSWNFSTPLTPPGSDQSDRSITRNGYTQQYLDHSSLRPLGESPTSDLARRSMLAPPPSTRAEYNFGYGQTSPTEELRSDNVIDLGGLDMWREINQSNPNSTMDHQSYSSDGPVTYPTSTGSDYSTMPARIPYNSALYQEWSPKTRQLPLPSAVVDYGSRGGSIAHPLPQGWQNECLEYGSDNYDLQRAMSQTSRSSMSSQTQDLTSLSSSSPKQYRSPIRAGYSVTAQPSTETLHAGMPGYRASEPTNASTGVNMPSRGLTQPDNHGCLPLYNSVYEYPIAAPPVQRQESYNSGPGGNGSRVYRQLRPQP